MEGSEMKTASNHPAEAGSGIFNGPVQSRVLLCAYLDIDYEIEAYCAVCDELWTISYEERRALISALLPAHG